MTLPVFETPRLILKSITEHDAEGLHEDSLLRAEWS